MLSIERGQGEWWQAVKEIAALVSREGVDINEDQFIRDELQAFGHSKEVISRAFDWLDKASLSGSLQESLDMLQPLVKSPRINNPREISTLPPLLFKIMERARSCGLVGAGMLERMLENMRSMDTRDWDKDEMNTFLYEILDALRHNGLPYAIESVLDGSARCQYS